MTTPAPLSGEEIAKLRYDADADRITFAGFRADNERLLATIDADRAKIRELNEALRRSQSLLYPYQAENETLREQLETALEALERFTAMKGVVAVIACETLAKIKGE